MSVTDKYKLVPYNGNNIPCDDCPIKQMCVVYNRYVDYNEIVGDNDLLNTCIRRCVSKNTLIPQLKDDEQSTSENSDS